MITEFKICVMISVHAPSIRLRLSMHDVMLGMSC